MLDIKHSDIFACVYFQKLLDEVITFCVFAWHSKMGEVSLPLVSHSLLLFRDE
jgi:hypothetical protein